MTWAKWSNGMFGQNTGLQERIRHGVLPPRADFLAEGRAEFADNMRNYYEYVKQSTIKVLTHTLVNPTFNYDQAKAGKYSDKVALQVVKETDAGLVVNGARLLATLGPHADEIEVFPSTLLTASEENLPFAFAFTMPVHAPGIRMICRDTYDHGKSHFDAPLASRFEEMDAVVVFDQVEVPWERVFMYREPLLCNRAFAETNAVVHMMHQVVCGKLAKAEFIVGLAVCHGPGNRQGQGHERHAAALPRRCGWLRVSAHSGFRRKPKLTRISMVTSYPCAGRWIPRATCSRECTRASLSWYSSWVRAHSWRPPAKPTCRMRWPVM